MIKFEYLAIDCKNELYTCVFYTEKLNKGIEIMKLDEEKAGQTFSATIVENGKILKSYKGRLHCDGTYTIE